MLHNGMFYGNTITIYVTALRNYAYPEKAATQAIYILRMGARLWRELQKNFKAAGKWTQAKYRIFQVLHTSVWKSGKSSYLWTENSHRQTNGFLKTENLEIPNINDVLWFCWHMLLCPLTPQNWFLFIRFRQNLAEAMPLYHAMMQCDALPPSSLTVR